MSDTSPQIATVIAYPARAIAWLKATVLGSSRAVQDVVVSMIPQGVRLITGFVTSVLIARGLGPAGLGQYTLVVSLTETAGQLSDLGIGQTAIRYASRAAAAGDTDEQLAVLRWAFRLRLLLVLLISAIFFALAPTLADKIWQVEGLAPLIRLGLLTAVFGVVASVPMIYFQSLKRFGMNATVLTGQTLIVFGGILLVAWINYWSVFLVIAVTIAAAGIGASIFLLVVPKKALVVPGEVKHSLRANPLALLRSPIPSQVQPGALDTANPDTFALFMLLSTVIVMLIMRADVWLMGIFLDQDQIGIYNAAMRFTLPLTILLNALNTALWPRASALTGVRETITLLRKTFRLSALTAGGGLLYAITAPLLAPWLFGQEYADSALLGQLLSLRYCFSLLICPIGLIGYSFGMVRVYWLVNLLQLIVVVITNVSLLPQYGPIGSAIALIINDAIGFLVLGTLIWLRLTQMTRWTGNG